MGLEFERRVFVPGTATTPRASTDLELDVPNSGQRSRVVALALVLLFAASPGPMLGQTSLPRDSASLTRAAQRGEAAAQYELGKLYLGGGQLAPNQAEALRWLRAAMAQGHAEATFRLAQLHESGSGVPLDRAGARRLFELAAERGSVEALSLLSNLTWAEGDRVRSIDWLARAARIGDAPSAYGLAVLYEQGLDGIMDRDTTAALPWYREAATLGHTAAQILLAERYATGTGGVARDPVRSFEWYLRAARAVADSTGLTNASAIATARTRVGETFLNGIGVTRDYEAALYWFQQAATAEACRELGKIYLHGLGVPKDSVRARRWLEKAAAGGDEVARRRLDELPPEPRPLGLYDRDTPTSTHKVADPGENSYLPRH